MLLVLFIPLTVLAQGDEDCPKPSKKAQKLFQNAISLNLKGHEAYSSLIKAVDIFPDYAAAYSALAYVNVKKAEAALRFPTINSMKQQRQAEKMAEKYWLLTIEKCPSYRNWEAYFLLGEFYYIKRSDFSNAKSYLQTFVANANQVENTDLIKADSYLKEIDIQNKLQKIRKNTRDSLLSNPVDFDPVKIKGVSSKNDEYLPVLSPDNQYLFFTRKEVIDTKTISGKKELERFTRSKNNYNHSFTVGEPMPNPFNGGQYQGGVSVSVDNKLILVTVVSLTPQKDGTLFSNGDIFYSEYTRNGWSGLKSIGTNINNPNTWEGQPSISADNKTLYFASARPPDGVTNYGGMDLYRSERNENGSWSDPINLGPTINTSGNEKTPFLHSDSYTLYFASDLHPGIGGFDIFYAKMDEENTFLPPKNIGYPINTEKDEHGFIVSTDGHKGYFSSNLDGNGLDIYSFEIPVEARPEKVVFVRGQIISGQEAAEGLEITLKNTETEKEVTAVIDEETGEYVGVIAVDEGEDAIMTAKKEGYAFSSQYISSTENLVGKPIETKLEIRKIEVGETYKINNITFATDSYALNKKVKTILNEFFDFLTTNPTVKVDIQGHTDNVGNPKDNMLLSKNRARAVYQYLIDRGIDNDRLAHEGFGQTSPEVSNETTEGRAQNRRTVFRIRSK